MLRYLIEKTNGLPVKHPAVRFFEVRQLDAEPLTNEQAILLLMQAMCDGEQVPHRLSVMQGGEWKVLAWQNPQPGRTDDKAFLDAYQPKPGPVAKPAAAARALLGGGGTLRVTGKRTS